MINKWLLICCKEPLQIDYDPIRCSQVKATMKRVTMGLQRENTLNLSSQEIDDVLERFDKHKGNQISRRGKDFILYIKYFL